MKLTKYAQSCFLIETEEQRILIDPGTYVNEETIKNFRRINVILFTHVDQDHCDPNNIKIIQENNIPKMYGNEEVTKKLEEANVDRPKIGVVQDGENISIGNINIQIVKGVHGYNPSFGDKGTPKSNGFVINDGKTSVYHCGDTLAFYHDYKADIVLVPACGFGYVMEPEVAVDFCLALGCKTAIPMHYDSPKQQMLNGKDRFVKCAEEKGLNYKVLENGESVEV